MEQSNLVLNKENFLWEEPILSPEKEVELRTQITVLENENTVLKEKNNSLETELAEIKAQNAYLKKMIFGQKSEKISVIMQGAVQLNFFNEAEMDAEASIETVEKVVTFKARKKKRTHKEAFDKLEIREVIHQVGDKSCPECGNEMKVVGKELVRDELVYVPAKMYLRKHYSEVVKCVSCGSDESKDIENDDIQKQIFKKGNVPSPMLEGSYCSPELLAHILYEKYVQAVPLDRQQKDYSALYAPVLKASMCNWVLFAAKRYALPVFEEMKKRLFEEPVIHADETGVNVINDPEKKTKGKAHKSQMWVYCSGKHAKKFVVLFEYRRTRKGENSAAFLGDYSGYVTCDGYDAYNSLKNAKRCGCFAHARRRFVNALPSDKELIPTSEAAKAIAYINKLYELERSYENLGFEEIHKQRQERSKPVLDEFFAWLEKVIASGNSNLAKAVNYALNERKYLCRFIESPYVSIDNNIAEGSIRPFTIGRKNWLFSDTPRGADASALWYSLTVTAFMNGLNVEEYFYRLLTSDKPVMPW